jgi:hypothetical protein
MISFRGLGANFGAGDCHPDAFVAVSCYRNILTGPGLATWDFSLVKNNNSRRISESFNVQFWAEFFNILNRLTLQHPSTILRLSIKMQLRNRGCPAQGSIATAQALQVARDVRRCLKRRLPSSKLRAALGLTRSVAGRVSRERKGAPTECMQGPIRRLPISISRRTGNPIVP